MGNFMRSFKAVGLSFLLFGAMYWLVNAVIGGSSILDMSFFGYSADDAYRILGDLGERGRELDLRRIVPVDCFFALSYGLFYVLALTYVWRRVFPEGRRHLLIGAVGAIACLADLLENACVYLMLTRWPVRLETVAAFSSVCTVCKTSFLLAGIFLMLAGTVILLARKQGSAAPFRWKALADLSHDRTGMKTIFHILAGLALFLASQFLASLVVDTFFLVTKLRWDALFVMVRGLLEIAFFLSLLKLYVYRALKLDFPFFRITGRRISVPLLAAALLLPTGVIGFYFLFTPGTLSFAGKDAFALNLAYALKVGLSAGITEEILFRGYIMKLVESRWNKKAAIVVPSVLFASLHLASGMGSTDVALLFVAGITVGIMFSSITYCTDSIWNSAITHALWNTLILGICHVSTKSDGKAIFRYILNTDTVFLTGGRFGIESAIPAITGYLLVLLLAVCLRNRYLKK